MGQSETQDWLRKMRCQVRQPTFDGKRDSSGRMHNSDISSSQGLKKKYLTACSKDQMVSVTHPAVIKDNCPISHCPRRAEKCFSDDTSFQRDFDGFSFGFDDNRQPWRVKEKNSSCYDFTIVASANHGSTKMYTPRYFGTDMPDLDDLRPLNQDKNLTHKFVAQNRAFELIRQLDNLTHNSPSEDSSHSLMINEATEFVSCLKSNNDVKSAPKIGFDVVSLNRNSDESQKQETDVGSLKSNVVAHSLEPNDSTVLCDMEDIPYSACETSPDLGHASGTFKSLSENFTEPQHSGVKPIVHDTILQPTILLGDEENISLGIGATFNLLKSRGLVKPNKDDDFNKKFCDRLKFLAGKRKREEEHFRYAKIQRESDRKSGKLNHMTSREREEYARCLNSARELHESRQLAELFDKEYKPDIQLSYTDEFGRQMDSKETFKHLSHMFHGKGSGNKKTEKRLKRIESEKKQESSSMLRN